MSAVILKNGNVEMASEAETTEILHSGKFHKSYGTFGLTEQQKVIRNYYNSLIADKEPLSHYQIQFKASLDAIVASQDLMSERMAKNLPTSSL